MASIVYITDRNMIEYHRLNGNQTMNFWRPSSSRKMSDFKPGDLLFFLAKGTERGITREKGIVGYGRYQQNNLLSVKQMWNMFQTENGYEKEQDFKEAVRKVSKNKKLPKVISGLYLKDVVYFQSPIYLSEIGVSISNMVESYFYLDKEDSSATAKVLNKAKEVGVDTWMAMLSQQEAEPFELDACRHTIAEVYRKLTPIYRDTEQKKAVKLVKKFYEDFIKQNQPAEMVRGSRTTFILLDQKKVEIFLPLVTTTKESLSKIQLIVGQATALKGLLKQKLPDYQIETTMITEMVLNPFQRQLLLASGVSYLYIEDVI